MTGALEAVARVTALLAASFVIQSTLVIGAVLFLAHVGTRTAVVRAVIYQATFAALAVLPLVSVLFYLSSRVLLAETVLAQWGRTASVASGVLAAVWVCGALIGLMRIAWAHRAMKSLRRRAVRLHSPAMHEGLHELAWYARVEAPEILVSDEVTSPMLTGFLNPAIILPSSLAGCSVDEGLLAVLQHELAHETRHDCLAKMLADVLCAVFFFQPLLRVTATRMEHAADEAADDMVLSGGATARDYASLLCTWAEQHLAPCERAAIGIGRFRSALGRRVERITGAARTLITRVSRLATGGIAYTMALLCVLVALLTMQCGIWLFGAASIPPAGLPGTKGGPSERSTSEQKRPQRKPEAAPSQPMVDERTAAAKEAQEEPVAPTELAPPEPAWEPVDEQAPQPGPPPAIVERVELLGLPPRHNWAVEEGALAVHVFRVDSKGMPKGRRERFVLKPLPGGHLVERLEGGEEGEVLDLWVLHSDGWGRRLRLVPVRRNAPGVWIITGKGMEQIKSYAAEALRAPVTFCKHPATESGSSEAGGAAPAEPGGEDPGD